MSKSESRVGASSVVPDELTWEILKFLPVKSLMRFKCVCKLWRSIIQNPLFTKSYRGSFKGVLLRRSCGYGQLTCDFFYLKFLYGDGDNDGISARISDFHSIVLGKPMASTAQVNGLVCLYNDSHSLIFNSATRETMDLPVSRCDIGTCNYHLGFDPGKKVYKVLKTGKRGLLQCEILTVGVDSSWRSIDPAPWKLESNANCANGCLFWNDENPVYFDDNGRQFLCFNTAQEKFQFIDEPSDGCRWLCGPHPVVVSDYYSWRGDGDTKITRLFYYNNEDDDAVGHWTEHQILTGSKEFVAVSTLPDGKVIFINKASRAWKSPFPFCVYDPTKRELKECITPDPDDVASSSITQYIVDLNDVVSQVFYREVNIIPLSCLGSSC